jgi:nitroreductase
MAVQSVAMAGENLLLMAHAEGLGACWMCAPLYSQDIVRDVLDLPSSWEPQGMIIVGHPSGEGRDRSRMSMDMVAIWR